VLENRTPSMRLCSATTTLLLLASTPAASQDFRLHEGLPAGFAVDGKLDEWTRPPSVTLGASHQVAGKSKVSSPKDLSARLWVALGPEGLAVAGEVQDDRVHLATRLEHVNHDHVEVWLALPQPKMPPIAFVNQFGEHEVPTLADCEDNAAISEGEPEDCREWWKQQVEHRKQLVRPFIIQYGLMSGSVVRFQQKDTVGSIRYVPMDGGYRFEALIPPSAFPRSAQAPLRDLKVLVDLVDSDEGKGRLETFLSSSARRRFGDPDTFHPVTLSRPLRFGQWPELLERALAANASSSYQPAPDAQALQVWCNPATAYQYAPQEPSPQVVGVDLSRMKPLGKLGEVEVVTMPAQVDWRGSVEHWLVSRRGQQVLDTQNVGADVLRLTSRASGLHLLRVDEGLQSALGTGACGACPVLNFKWVKMDAQGRFSQPEGLEGIYSQGEELAWEATPDLARIEAFIQWEDEGPRRRAIRHTWNPKQGRYTTEKFERPSHAGSVAGDTQP
jgi:hypothetical protein